MKSKKENLIKPDPLLNLLNKLEMQRAELYRSMRAFEPTKQNLLDQLADYDIQEQILEALEESIDILNNRIIERDGLPD